MSLNKVHSFVSYQLDVRSSSLPDVRADAPSPTPEEETSMHVSFTPGTKSPAPSPAKVSESAVGQKSFPRSATGIKAPRSSSRSSGRKLQVAPPVPALPHKSNTKRGRSTLPKYSDGCEPLQGPTGHPALLTPNADYYRMERPRPARRESRATRPSNGPNYTYEYERGRGYGAAPISQLPKLPEIHNTPVFAGTEFDEERERGSAFLSSKNIRNAPASSGKGPKQWVDIEIAPANGVSSEGIELQTLSASGHGCTHPTDSSRDCHPDGPHHFRANHKPSLTSLLIATGLDKSQKTKHKPSFGSLLSTVDHKPSEASLNSHLAVNDASVEKKSSTRSLRGILKPAASSQVNVWPSSFSPNTPGESLRKCPFINSHLQLSTHFGQLSRDILTSLHQLRKQIATMTPSSAQRYASFNRLNQYKMDLNRLVAGVDDLGESLESLVRENRLFGQPERVKWAMVHNMEELEQATREARRLWEEVRVEWEEMAAGGARSRGWWGWIPGMDCCWGL
ncbi:hypothetical protein BZA77DRAFT_296688 [Pyronema omphalodes]|nr:hypothetical protein BZA77DRAFT_296688 [Pyronema omphalodes]